MDNISLDWIWKVQTAFAADPKYAQLLQEYRVTNAVLLQQLETMTPRQQEAVLDYCGVLVELHLKMLEHSVWQDM